MRHLLFPLVAFAVALPAVSASANATPQTLSYSQDWSNAALITVNDDWSMVPGVIGYLGPDITTVTAVDPQTLLTESSVASDVDVIANQTNPATNSTGACSRGTDSMGR